MNIGVIGISHRKAAVEVRERFTFTTRTKADCSEALRHLGIPEFMILATCNRTEIYFAGPEPEKLAKEIRDFCLQRFGQDLTEYLYSYCERDAVVHLHRVASGLDSLVIGEDQILGQVKDAFELAMESGNSKKVLNKCLRESITFAKKMKTQYRMSENQLSIASIAVKYAAEKVGGLSGKKVMLIGTGKIGSLAYRYLKEQNPKAIYLASRIAQDKKKEELMKIRFPDVILTDYEQRYELAGEMDLIFSATAYPKLVLERDRMPSFDKPVLLMDMALPHDIDRRLTDADQVSLHGLDDLREIEDQSVRYRLKVAEKIQHWIECQADELENWGMLAHLDETLVRFNKLNEQVYERTLKMIESKMTLTDREHTNMKKIVRSCIKQVAGTPIRQMKSLDNPLEIQEMKRAMEYLFLLDSEG